MTGRNGKTSPNKKNGGSPQKNGGSPTKNGVASSSKMTTPTTPTKRSSFSLVYVVVALLSFMAGVWTPALLSHPTALKVQRRLRTFATGAKPPTCDEEALSHFLHEAPVAGMHVVCLEDSEELQVKLFQGSKIGTLQQASSEKSWEGLRDTLNDNLSLPAADELHQPWAIFSSVGVRIADEETSKDESTRVLDELLDSGLVVLFEGGQWLWPGVRVGYKRTIDLYSIMPGTPPSIPLPSKKSAVLETLSLQPLVIGVDWFLSEDECNHVQETALPSMKHSGVMFTDADKGKDVEEFRTSSNTFLYARDDMLKEIDYRTASLVRIPRNHQEQAQVLRYEKTQHYVAHHDYFNPIFYTGDPNTLRLVENGRKNRLATVFWYLSDVAKGGETVFPRWNGAPQPTDFGDCTKGLKVKPKRGKVIIFYSMTPDGELDEYSMHGACPVEEGIKWAANKWVWNLPMKYVPDE